MTAPEQFVTLIDQQAAALRYGCCTSKFYTDVHRGLMPAPLRMGPKFMRWPACEVDAVIRARLAGADDATVRELVQVLHAARAVGSKGTSITPALQGSPE